MNTLPLTVFSAPYFVLESHKHKTGSCAERRNRDAERAGMLQGAADAFRVSNISRLREIALRDYPDKSLEECINTSTGHLISLMSAQDEDIHVRLAALNALRGMAELLPGFRLSITEKVMQVMAKQDFKNPLWGAVDYFLSDRKRPVRIKGALFTITASSLPQPRIQ